MVADKLFMAKAEITPPIPLSIVNWICFSCPSFGSKGKFLQLQGEEVSREGGNPTTNIQNLKYPCNIIPMNYLMEK